ncbi:hypothetical protein N5P37_010491 [Trichoderma harzianum]|uniref:Uncharacterized protein n=1 Tax=Trichoderma harzianum CBS 226.95 TaxID=983964 RepID=A0A2T4A0F0_TRIHA|nr:hypothetical protein M431DRAFT_485912 [Trichoderma harzianum CBS 226.95]KAK0756967.1 hypothetical protein N5P37_010491 [Trichoderma harzianum]PKK50183.1 hypothetical protein CI102_7178 [Trichoderma harzianum]PTB50544.1 hypothetical protein M431DRAFT_485912 [Trichoderma harzianum CBS 226.95]
MQPRSKNNSVHSFVGSTTNVERTTSAADDGGIQMWDTTRGVFRQVALLEAKRTLEFADGEPRVSDEVLAHMVGQALALHRSNNPLYVAASPERTITILANAYFIKFYTFEFPQGYDANYEGQSMTTPGCHLHVYSSTWLNIQRADHRRRFVAHLSAIIAWANSL